MQEPAIDRNRRKHRGIHQGSDMQQMGEEGRAHKGERPR